MSLQTYLQTNKITYDDFGAAIGVTGTSVYRYITGRRLPKPKIIQKIISATKGTVTFADFYEQPVIKPIRKR